MKQFGFPILASAFFLGVGVNSLRAQSYSIDWFTIDGGGGTSTGGGYLMSGTIGQIDSGTMSGGGYTLEGAFWSIDAAVTPPITIFDNTSGSDNGYEVATTTTWLANKFCLGPQAYQLDSVTLLLVSGDNNGEPRIRNVRLQIYSNDPVAGKPSASTGVIMNLSGATNPIALPPSFIQAPITWTPATSFTLSADTCYWAVLSLDSGASVGLTASVTMPTGVAGVFGRASSSDAGATWPSLDNGSNRKMRILGTAFPAPPQLVITATERIGPDLRLSFTSIAGKNYAVQSRADLLSGGWTNLPGAPISGTGGTVQVTLPNALGQPQQFYRVQVVP
jgi:hypothetical protein